LLEIRGDVREGLAPEEESLESAEASANEKVYYVVRKWDLVTMRKHAYAKQILKWICPIYHLLYPRNCLFVNPMHLLGEGAVPSVMRVSFLLHLP
jgi:hypothetical protein